MAFKPSCAYVVALDRRDESSSTHLHFDEGACNYFETSYGGLEIIYAFTKDVAVRYPVYE